MRLTSSWSFLAFPCGYLTKFMRQNMSTKDFHPEWFPLCPVTIRRNLRAETWTWSSRIKTWKRWELCPVAMRRSLRIKTWPWSLRIGVPISTTEWQALWPLWMLFSIWFCRHLWGWGPDFVGCDLFPFYSPPRFVFWYHFIGIFFAKNQESEKIKLSFCRPYVRSPQNT